MLVLDYTSSSTLFDSLEHPEGTEIKLRSKSRVSEQNIKISGDLLCCFLVSEKWHDQNAAQDVVWVNQTFWMESELDLLDNVWETSEKASHFYNQQTKSSASQKER